MVPKGIKIGKEQFNVLAYADDIALIGKKLYRNMKTFCKNGKHCKKVWTRKAKKKTKFMRMERKKKFKEK
jgi:hypothetical protein